ncbi:MAG: EamA family transporter [Azonexus sp.]|jgi:undecaprenyl phosphate-alpha-L-ara4N flippase subunit ArnE|uniref:EamA family transporter n=1 Tax=Azonexus sp. TaxID=1872668 RepID=UPI00283321F1|nr:EamA family transporter [Azonexus sp.]MDR0775158.1 EamA family transporter [Azonexus sp.]
MNPWFAIAGTIVLTVVGQLLQKRVALRFGAAERGSALSFYLRASDFWLALLCLAGAMALWLVALASFEVSKAYALLGINYLLVPLAAIWLFGERLSARGWLGALLVCAGVFLIGRS